MDIFLGKYTSHGLNGVVVNLYLNPDGLLYWKMLDNRGPTFSLSDLNEWRELASVNIDWSETLK